MPEFRGHSLEKTSWNPLFSSMTMTIRSGRGKADLGLASIRDWAHADVSKRPIRLPVMESNNNPVAKRQIVLETLIRTHSLLSERRTTKAQDAVSVPIIEV